jgi:signal transduction histidine kinase
VIARQVKQMTGWSTTCSTCRASRAQDHPAQGGDRPARRDPAGDRDQPPAGGPRGTRDVTLAEAPVIVDGRRVPLAQVVANLLNNAAKYSEPGAHIHVELRREDQPDRASFACATTVSASRRHAAARLRGLHPARRDAAERRGGLGIG